MLQVSDTAATAFREFLDRDDVPGTAIRLEPAGGPSENSSSEIRMATVDAPADGDVQAAATGVDIYVAPELSEPLDDAILDAEITPQGAQLVLRRA